MSAQAILSILKNGEVVGDEIIGGESSEELFIGRESGCHIRLDDRAVSRKHAGLKVVKGGVQIEQKSEFAPLLVNGAEGTSFMLKEGDVIAIGPYLLRLKLEKENSALAAPNQEVVQESGLAPVIAIDSQSSAASSMPALEMPAVEMNGESAHNLDPVLPEEPAGAESSAPMEMNLESPSEENPSSEVPDFDLNLNGGQQHGNEGAQSDAVQDLGNVSFGENIEEDGKTSVGVLPTVESVLVFAPGAANVTEFKLTEAPIHIGRGNQCEIVLNDKKSSRKHAVIMRAGAQYLIKDLGSANGIYINGNKTTEQLLSGGDLVRIGDVEFEFKSEDQNYSAKSQDFLQVTEEEPAPFESPVESIPGQDFAPIPGFEAPAQAEAPKKRGSIFYDKYIRNFKNLKPTQKLMVVLAVGFIMWNLFEDESPTPEELKAMKQKRAGITAGTGARSFQALTLDQKKYVQSQYDLGFNLYTLREYDKSLFEIRKVFDLVDDYKNSREIEKFALDAKKKMESLEQERRKKEEDEKLKVKVAELVSQVEVAMKAEKYDEAKALFSEILTLDPDNAAISGFKKQISDYEERKRIEAQNRQVQDEINKRAREYLAEADGYKKSGRYHSAIAQYAKVIDQRPSEENLIKRAQGGISASRRSISNLREPLLSEAKKLEEAGDYSGAYKAYRRAIKVDPPHPEGYKGVERVRGVLHERAKGFYTEGVLAESYSDFVSAKKKFEECMASAPEDDIYYGRARRRLMKYSKKLFEGSTQ